MDSGSAIDFRTVATIGFHSSESPFLLDFHSIATILSSGRRHLELILLPFQGGIWRNYAL